MITVEDFLKPVSDAQPCGEDFTYHPTFQNLETIARGKAETQFSAAEEPDWKEVRDVATEVLGQSKHLTAAVLLTEALLKIGGLEGFRDGIAVTRGLIEKYWGDAYPKLDPEDNNDPTERLNILNSYSGQKFSLHLKQMALCQSPSLGRITLMQAINAKERASKPDAGPAPAGEPDLNQIQAVFRDIGPEACRATLALINESTEHVKAIDAFMDTTLGAGQGVNFETLIKLLSEMKGVVEPHAAGDGSGGGDAGGGDAVAGDASGGGDGRSAGRGGQSVSGTIQTRADVIKALNLICDYYRDNEPSSPVPLILKRAERLVDKNFMDIVNDLTPDAMTQLKVITGSTE